MCNVESTPLFNKIGVFILISDHQGLGKPPWHNLWANEACIPVDFLANVTRSKQDKYKDFASELFW